MNWLKAVVSNFRNIRSDMNINPGERIAAHIHTRTSQDNEYLQNNLSIVMELARLNSLEELNDSEFEEMNQSNAVSALINETRIIVPVQEVVGFDEQIKRLNKEIESHSSQIRRSNSKLENEQFLAKAPAEIIDKERRRLASCQKALAELMARREKLTQMTVQ